MFVYLGQASLLVLAETERDQMRVTFQKTVRDVDNVFVIPDNKSGEIYCVSPIAACRLFASGTMNWALLSALF